MTPISALSFLPLPGQPPSGQTGIPGAPPVLGAEVAPGAVPPVSGEASALSWLVAWLGEPDTETELPEAIPEEVAPPVSTPSKVHWLSLLPAVVTFEVPVITEPYPSDQKPVALEAAVPALAESEAPILPVEVSEWEESVDQEEPTPTRDAELEPAAKAVLEPLTPVATPVAVSVPVPVDTDSAAPLSTELPENVRGESPKVDAAPDKSPVERPAVMNGETQRPMLRKEDKGEVIWSAKFAVTEEQEVDAGVSETVVATRPQPETKVRLPRSPEAVPPTKPTATGVRTRQSEETPRPQLDAEHPEADGGEREKQKPPAETPRERTASRSSQDTKRESASAGIEHSEPKAPESGPRISTFGVEFASRAPTPSRVGEAGPVASVALEPAIPLKPAQIATLQVDVPAPVGSDDTPPMRLVVTQRGDQVNVRLRSFDSTVAPIEDSRMQPLLHSLAEKGFVSELKPGARLDESMPVMVERTQEKQMVMAEPSGSQNDAQSFQNANERQQQNQERQQQQQAFFLRKQLKNVQSEAFTLPVAAEANKDTFQQGVSR